MEMPEATCFPVDAHWIQETILKDEQERATLLSIGQPKRIDEGWGYHSHIWRVELSWNSQLNSLPQSVVLKIHTQSKIMAQMDKMEMSEKTWVIFRPLEELDAAQSYELIHRNECSFYNFLRGHCVSFPVPRCYFVEASYHADVPPMLVFEDFGTRGACINMLDALSVEQVLPVAEAIAEYQAFFMQHPGWEGKIIPIWDKAGRIIDVRETFASTMAFIYDKVHEVAPEALCNLSKSDVCQLAVYSKEWDVLFYDVEMYCTPVMCHGDLHAHNLLFEKRDGKFTNQLLGIIDWQQVHLGNPAEDLCRLLVMSVDADVRRSCETAVLEVYYARLQALLQPNLTPFTFSEVQSWYYRSMRFQALYGLMIAPFLAPAAKCSQEVLNQVAKRGVYAVEDALARAVWP